MKILDDRRFRFGYVVVSLFTVFAGDALRYSISWYGFGAVVALMAAVSVLILIRERRRWSIGRLPFPVTAFLALATLSLAWSFYPGATLVGLAATWLTVIGGLGIALAVDWNALVRAMGVTLRIVLGGSLLFELIVSVFVRAPVLPFFPSPGVDYADLDKVPQLFYWSRNVLFEGDKIQGLVGNSSLLGFMALLGVIVFGVQFAARTVGRASGLFWLGIATLVIYLTRSATITIALVALAALTVAVLLVRRAGTTRSRRITYAGLIAAVVAGIVGAIVFSSQILLALGKTDTLTHRTDIWANVIHLAQQRPIFGWGWVSYWAPWVAPFDTLAFNSGVRQLHAHNAWLDIWLQLGIVGLVVFGALVLSTLVRSWLLATDRPISGLDRTGSYSPLTLLPLLVIAALVIQSAAESRLIVEYGIVLLVVVAVKTRRGDAFVRNLAHNQTP
ncbi:MAG: O-antigen ligase family protein [Microbacteriaceae bacterium]